MKILRILCISAMLIGCSATGTRWVRNEQGELEVVEKLSLRGIGNRKVTFGTGGNIENDSGLRIPNLELDLESLTKE